MQAKNGTRAWSAGIKTNNIIGIKEDRSWIMQMIRTFAFTRSRGMMGSEAAMEAPDSSMPRSPATSMLAVMTVSIIKKISKNMYKLMPVMDWKPCAAGRNITKGNTSGMNKYMAPCKSLVRLVKSFRM